MAEKNIEKEQAKTPKKKDKKQKSILVKANKKGLHINGFLNFLRVCALPFIWLVRPYRFYGNRKVGKGACVYVCNHYTMLDIAYIASTTWESIHIIAKSEVKKTPVLSWLTDAVKVIAVNRNGNDVRALLDCFKCLKNGEKIVIFPEGTRNKTDAEMLPFKHGASIMAIKTKTPIIPVMIYKKPKYFRFTDILIGDPIEFTEYYDRKLTDADYAEADEKLRLLMLDMRAKHTEFLGNKKNKKKKA